MSTVYISLGSNLGDRAQNIARAVKALGARGVRVTRQSSLYETEPVDVRGDGWFLNGVVEAETNMLPRQLMQTLLIIERSLGRKRRPNSEGPKESRTIDMDVLLFGSSVDERAGAGDSSSADGGAEIRARALRRDRGWSGTSRAQEDHCSASRRDAGSERSSIVARAIELAAWAHT